MLQFTIQQRRIRGWVKGDGHHLGCKGDDSPCNMFSKLRSVCANGFRSASIAPKQEYESGRFLVKRFLSDWVLRIKLMGRMVTICPDRHGLGRQALQGSV